jgi:hypothetical protein
MLDASSEKTNMKNVQGRRQGVRQVFLTTDVKTLKVGSICCSHRV